MMRQAVVAFGQADLRIVTGALLNAEQDSDDARRIRLKREHHQIQHQVGVLREVGRDGRRRRLCRGLHHIAPLHALDSLFDISNGGEIFIEFASVVASERFLKTRLITEYEIKNASSIFDLTTASGGILLGSFIRRRSKQALENGTRTDLRRIRSILGSPRNTVAIRAAI